jgi:hypothetical protein
MVGPQDLLAIGHLRGRERRGAVMPARERGVVRRMPVLRHHHQLEAGGEAGNPRHDLVAAGDGEGAAGAEVDLRVDDDQRVAAPGLETAHSSLLIP